MNSKIYQIIKFELKTIVLLYSLFVIPLILFYKFSSYPLPNIQYVLLGILFLWGYFLVDEVKYRNKIEDKVVKLMKRDLGRIPSKKEIVIKVRELGDGRFVSIVLTALGIFGCMIYFNQF
jgi:hypothetical protein